MQTSLSFSRHPDLPAILERLEYAFGPQARRKRDALRQLIYMVVAEGAAPSVGLAVFDRLQAVYPNWPRLRDADPRDLRALFIGLPDREKKAFAVPEILQAIEDQTGDLDLDHLARLSTEAATAWLEALPGISQSMACAVLAFSTLERPSLSVDRENVRPIRRLGLCAPGAPMSAVAREVLEAAPPEWSGSQVAGLTHGLSRLASSVCHRGKPDCARCPLMTLCPTSGHTAEVLSFPGAKERQARPALRSA